jgi:hypothetical protein
MECLIWRLRTAIRFWHDIAEYCYGRAALIQQNERIGTQGRNGRNGLSGSDVIMVSEPVEAGGALDILCPFFACMHGRFVIHTSVQAQLVNASLHIFRRLTAENDDMLP